MTELLEQAIARIRMLPDSMQDDAARMVLSYFGEGDALPGLTPEEEADLATSRAQADCGQFASDADMRNILSKD